MSESSLVFSGAVNAALPEKTLGTNAPLASAASHSKDKLPPMLQQYLEYKSKYSDALLLFQVGDFYEVFFDDALTVSRTLNLTLTSRDKNNPNPVPMCGVPIGVVDNYVERLVQAGFSVALVSQTLENAQPGTRAMVGRKLERIVTPGIRLLSNAEGQQGEALVAAVSYISDQDLALSFCDVQSGRIFVREGFSLAKLREEILRISPSELVLPSTIDGKKLDRRTPWVRDIEGPGGPVSIKFRSEDISQALASARELSGLVGYNALGVAGRRSVKILLQYIDEITVSSRVPIVEISQANYDGYLIIDATTRNNLELVRNQRDGSTRGTLYGCIDRSCTAAGSRLLRQWILAPLLNRDGIMRRQSLVALFAHAPNFRDQLRLHLKYLTDLERIAARIELSMVSPRELGALRDTLQKIPEISELLASVENESSDTESEYNPMLELQRIRRGFVANPELTELLNNSLSDSPPPFLSEGGIIRDGFSEDLDRLRSIRANGRSWIAELESAERARSGISTLKIKFNNVFGYFIEVSTANLAKVPPEYTRKQTTVSGERFTTPELKEREAEVLGAQDKQYILERQLFEKLRAKVQPSTSEIRAIAQLLAELDALVALADLADREGYVRPEILSTLELRIESGRHPVISQILRDRFVPNSMALGPSADTHNSHCVIITGPNMGGKTTYLRQAALIVILAQIGSFVPAKKAKVGIVDKIFARIGASDNVLEGESTFLVEMRESAHIVAGATERSLVLVDEIGRGTATSDGLAIAHAVLEWLILKTRCRTLFATHFYELTALDQQYSGVRNLSVGSVDRDGEVIFTHEICEGAASRSYGLEVARLAGLPASLLVRAGELLKCNESKTKKSATDSEQRQLSIFAKSATVFKKEQENKEPEDYQELKLLKQRIEALQLDELTPLQALNSLNSLQVELRSSGKVNKGDR